MVLTENFGTSVSTITTSTTSRRPEQRSPTGGAITTTRDRTALLGACLRLSMQHVTGAWISTPISQSFNLATWTLRTSSW
jgi:hypothetical protein